MGIVSARAQVALHFCSRWMTIQRPETFGSCRTVVLQEQTVKPGFPQQDETMPLFETELVDVEREVSPTAAALEVIVGLLEDMTSEQQQLFDEAVQRRGPFFGERLVELEDTVDRSGWICNPAARRRIVNPP
jgi:hypothetical protein